MLKKGTDVCKFIEPHIITGAGIANEEGVKYSESEMRTYSGWGVVAQLLDAPIVNESLSLTSSIVEVCARNSKNDMVSEWSEGIGYLAGEATKTTLSAIKTLAYNQDKLRPFECMIKMFSYCQEERQSYLIDTSIAEMIAKMPIPQNKAYKIYTQNQIGIIDEIKRVNFNRSESVAIGFLLYYMMRAVQSYNGVNRRVDECLDILGVSDYKKEYEDKYPLVAKDKADQVWMAERVFDIFASPKNLRLDLNYVSRVVGKMKYYVPEGYTRTGKIMELSEKGIDAFINHDQEAGANACGEAIAFVFSIIKGERDDIKEECRKSFVKDHGIDGDFVDKEIMPDADSIIEMSELEGNQNG